MASNDPSGSSRVSDLEYSLAVNPPSPAPAGEGYAYEHATTSIVVAMIVNLVIAVIKGIAWQLTFSSAMLSEALHSFGDAINSFALLIGIRLSSRAPDKTHPFGYGLEASVWAIVACAFLLVSSLVSIFEGVKRFSHEEPLNYDAAWGILTPFNLSVGILVISLVLESYAVQRASHAVLEELGIESKGWLDTIQKAFKHVKRVVGPTTRFVFYEDCIAFLGAIIALIAIVLSHWAVEIGIIPAEFSHWPDNIASILIGFLLMGMSVYLFVHNRTLLTGTSAAPTIEHRINDLVMNIHGVSQVHDLKTVDRGPAGLTIHMKVEVEPDTMVKDVDDLTERIKEKLQSRIPNVSSVFIEVLADESEVEWAEKFNTLVEEGAKEGVLKPREVAILQNFPDFIEATAEDVMVPRTDVEAVELDTPLSEVADLIVETGHSRIPVYEESMDEIRGVIFARDVFQKLRDNQMDTLIAELLHPIDIFPENKPVSDLLEEFKQRKIQMAVVADEHGGFAGIVTLENLLEEIVGELWDEHDTEELKFELKAPNELIVSGKYNIEELNEKINTAIPNDEFLTVGGYVFGTLGREPKNGDSIQTEDLTMQVLEMDGHRVDLILIQSPVPFELPNQENDATQA